jgi:hypothetical protein
MLSKPQISHKFTVNERFRHLRAAYLRGFYGEQACADSVTGGNMPRLIGHCPVICAPLHGAGAGLAGGERRRRT